VELHGDVIEERAVVVGVEFAERDREEGADAVDRGADALLASALDGLALGPAGGDIDGDQGGEEEAIGVVSTVGDQVGLEGAGPDVRPVAKGADGDLGAQGGGSGVEEYGPAEAPVPIGLEQAINRRSHSSDVWAGRLWQVAWNCQ